MQKASSKFHGIDFIADEKRVLGLIAQEDCSKEFFAEYDSLLIEDFKLCLKECKKKRKKCQRTGRQRPRFGISSFNSAAGSYTSVLRKQFRRSPYICSKEKTTSVSLQSRGDG